ncbi:SAM-dependent methyltransferase [Sphingobacterium sp. lm-10]|uniref:class I SAM-dependent methyltransferase n=1 Tax=Sphingobacterium sp. lm-10 TaxID=2944904 RepID=UPI0020202880|nr:SAM-dependent methyltransferase [Sphingobacterium sp. lm-10]MCL7986983.1 SAM-dependent methyltransferase [Sphingobacterium sp. lm-10]
MKFIDKSDVLQLLKKYIGSTELVKATLGSYKGEEADLKNIYLKPVRIKNTYQLSFTYRYARRDTVKNYDLLLAEEMVISFCEAEDFHSVSLFLQQENIFFQLHPKKGWSYRQEPVANCCVPNLEHNKQKERKITDTKSPYLHELRLTDADGKVYKNAQDKWKQINHYIEILSSTLAELPQKDGLRIVDMGAGKGYLTFALHDYLSQQSNKMVETVGVEFRKDLVDLCNAIASKAALSGLRFVEGTIEAYQPAVPMDVLIALHACDTATDDAIFKGIQHQADLIVVAPCCHKQVRRELEHHKAKNELNFMTRHGIFMERHAEMLTDSIRALLLEYYGYQTKVVEFVSDAHTPKNVLIIGLRKKINPERQKEIQTKLNSMKMYFGLESHYLERLLKEAALLDD